MGIHLKNTKREMFIKSAKSKKKERPLSSKQIIEKIRSKIRIQTAGETDNRSREIQNNTIENYSNHYLAFRKKHKRNPSNSEIKKLITKTIAEMYLQLKKERK